jgi:hypothetical protein
VRDALVDALDRRAADGGVMAGEDVAGVVVGVVAADGADEGQPVHARGEARQVFAESQAFHGGRDGAIGAADFRRGVGLGVEGLELAPAAEEEQADDRLRLANGSGG